MPVSTINHQGKTILYIDYTPYKNKDEMIANLHKVADYYKKAILPVSSLTDVTGAYLSNEFIDEMKSLTREVFQEKSNKAAVIGITGIKKILLDAFNMITKNGGIKAFNTKEEALSYLTR